MRPLFTFLMALLLLALALPTAAQSETDIENASDVTISATIRAYVLSAPRANAEFVRSFEAGASEPAFGRDEAGNWLRILDGWVLAEVFRGQGETAQLPDVTASVNVVFAAAAQLYAGPSARWFDAVGEVEADTEALAIGRNEGGGWLRLPQGWIEVAHVNAAGDIRPLPVMASPGVVITAKSRTFILAEPDLGAEFVDVFEAGEEALATGRAGDWLQIARGWVSAEAVEVSGDSESLPYAGEGVPIVSKWSSPLSVRTLPSTNTVTGARTLRRVEPGAQETAIGRTENGMYLFLGDGWVLASRFEASGDIGKLPVFDETIVSTSTTASSSDATRSTEAVEVSEDFAGLPFTGSGLTFYTLRDRLIYYEPYSMRRTGQRFKSGERITAIGRNSRGTWLQVDGGWIAVSTNPSTYVAVIDSNRGDISTISELPITDRTASTTRATTSSARLTPTTRASTGLDARTIRSLVFRHTDDIRILDIEIANNATTIEYDLKPWPFVPNEQIANEVAFKIICAIRNGQQIPNRLKLIGQSHFKSDVGRKFTAPSVEISITASNANRIVCRGNSYSDINWRSLASQYKSHPIPKGASVDYD